MPKKIILDTDDSLEFQMLGVATTMREYRMAYYLNKLLFLHLTKGEDLEVLPPDSDDSACFTFYYEEKPDSPLNYYLIANRNKESWLIPDQKQSDYFLVVDGSLSQETLNRFLKTIRSIPNVITAFRINLKNSRKIETLLMELELHTVAYRQHFRRNT